MIIKRQREYSLGDQGYGLIGELGKPSTKRGQVDEAQQAELNRIARNRDFDSLKRKAKHKFDLVKLDMGNVRSTGEDYKNYLSDRDQAIKDYEKGERKIARAEKWEDRKLAAKHTLQDWDASYEDKTGRDLGKDAAIAGAALAAGAAGYGAYRAWKKKKKAAKAEAEKKFKK